MNVKEYIESGILESYAMGMCSDAERNGVEAMLEKHPALRAELAHIEQSIEALAVASAVEPPPAVKAGLMQAIAATETLGRVVELRQTVTADKGKRKFNWLAAASVVLLVASGSANFFLYNKYIEAQERYLAMESQNATLASELDVTKTNLDNTNDQLAFMRDPMTVEVVMAGMPISPQSQATVFWNSKSTEVYLEVNSLPQPAADKQYQLWAIVDGAPVDAGVFVISDSLQKMKVMGGAQAFAVTLEKKGGSENPTMDQLYVLGNVTP